MHATNTEQYPISMLSNFFKIKFNEFVSDFGGKVTPGGRTCEECRAHRDRVGATHGLFLCMMFKCAMMNNVELHEFMGVNVHGMHTHSCLLHLRFTAIIILTKPHHFNVHKRRRSSNFRMRAKCIHHFRLLFVVDVEWRRFGHVRDPTTLQREPSADKNTLNEANEHKFIETSTTPMMIQYFGRSSRILAA